MFYPSNYKVQTINGCMNCKYKFVDFDWCCMKIFTLSDDLTYQNASFLHFFYVDETGICDDWIQENG